MTLLDAYERFCVHRSAYCSIKSMSYYKKCVRYFVDFCQDTYFIVADDFDCKDLDSAAFLKFVIHLRSHKRYSKHPLRDVMTVNGFIKNTTIRSYCRAVHAFLKYIYKNGWSDTDLTEDVVFPRADPDLIVPLSINEVSSLHNNFDLSTYLGCRNCVIFHLMLDCGLRMQEVAHLRIKDFNQEDSFLQIIDTKYNKSRFLPVPERLVRFLKTYLSIYRSVADADDPLFLKDDGTSINENTIERAFQKLKHASIVERIHPHLCRHTFATSYIMGGGDMETLRILMGHEDYTVTKGYLHLAGQCGIMKYPIYQLEKNYLKRGY